MTDLRAHSKEKSSEFKRFKLTFKGQNGDSTEGKGDCRFGLCESFKGASGGQPSQMVTVGHFLFHT